MNAEQQATVPSASESGPVGEAPLRVDVDPFTVVSWELGRDGALRDA